jgi:hypothetical protein
VRDEEESRAKVVGGDRGAGGRSVGSLSVRGVRDAENGDGGE